MRPIIATTFSAAALFDGLQLQWLHDSSIDPVAALDTALGRLLEPPPRWAADD